MAAARSCCRPGAARCPRAVSSRSLRLCERYRPFPTCAGRRSWQSAGCSTGWTDRPPSSDDADSGTRRPRFPFVHPASRRTDCRSECDNGHSRSPRSSRRGRSDRERSEGSSPRDCRDAAPSQRGAYRSQPWRGCLSLVRMRDWTGHCPPDQTPAFSRTSIDFLALSAGLTPYWASAMRPC